MADPDPPGAARPVGRQTAAGSAADSAAGSAAGSAGGLLDRVPAPLFPVVAALLAFMAAIACFTPRFVLWKGLDIPPAFFNPEINRAVEVWKQCRHPFAPIGSATNLAIRWRPLFPLLAWLLHLPRALFLALPALGCLLVLIYGACLVERESRDRNAAVLAATLLATASWFLVSTGWLAYFDSWYVLALLVVVFSPSTRRLTLACLLAPWIDERFLLGLPLSLLLRPQWGGRPGRTPSRRVWLVALLAVAPYLLIRLGALLSGHDSFLQEYTLGQAHYLAQAPPAATLLRGAWMGLRSLWLFVILGAWLSFSSRRAASDAVRLAALALTAVAALLFSGDLSRSLSVLVPSALAGLLLFHRLQVPRRGLMLAGAVLLNLLSPASHVVATFTAPVSPLHAEIRHAHNPPDFLRPDVYNRDGAELLRANKPQEAMESFTLALRLDARDAAAFRGRAEARAAGGDTTGAVQDLRSALAVAAADWEGRVEAERRLEEWGRGH